MVNKSHSLKNHLDSTYLCGFDSQKIANSNSPSHRALG